MLGLLLLQVLASCLWLGHSEVGTSFDNCLQFFCEGITPNDALHPQNPAWICQYYNNSYRYATLYDREKRIPVYSAYIYQPGSDKIPHTWFFVEPQLITENNLKEMEREWVLTDQDKFTIDQIKDSQAVLDDYRKMAGLDRGQLCPSVHQYNTESKTATFALTNAVPLDSSLYTGQWNTYVSDTMREKSAGCTTTYVITGAVPGDIQVGGGRVNSPSNIWSAACCLVGSHPWKAWGAITENYKNKVEILTLGELEDRLSMLYRGRMVTLFKNFCPRQ
ncbi:ENDD1 protein, partial [Erythrocercus mccallii]|nr:ENDD1 protein [Erythrocercus mccallii]